MLLPAVAGTAAPQMAAGAASSTPAATTMVRGRVKIVNNSVLADNGQPLRLVHSHLLDWGYNNYLSQVSWWKQMRDAGHFNGVRVMAYLGQWASSTNNPMDMPTLLARLDVVVQNASQTGMYVLLDNHSECCGAEDINNDSTFWRAIAPRYANNTNVFYEVKNEPWQYDIGGYGNYEESMYSLVRSLAPNTHIIMWTIENLMDQPLATELGYIQAATQIHYNNASVGIHPYDSNGDVQGFKNYVSQLKAKYPVFLTELSSVPVNGSPDQTIFPWLDQVGVGWAWLDGTGFQPVGGPCYGPACSTPLNVYWTLDPGTLGQPVPTPTPVPPTGPLANGAYTITNQYSKLLLDDPAASVTSGTQIIQWAANGGSNQKWQFTNNGNGQYTIMNTASGLYLTDTGNGALTQVLQNNGTSQLWTLKAVSSGSFTLANVGTGKVIDDPGFSMTQGQGIITWQANSGANQNWTVK